MLYVQQVRSRKDALVPIRRAEMENDLKIEIVDMSALNGVELLAMDSDQIYEVVTTTTSTCGSGSISPCLSPASSYDERSSTPSLTASNSDNPRPRKRAKLDHLSQEEKAQHRKMMNRISAQSARDRQKAFIQQQDKTIKGLNLDVDGLKEENTKLKGLNERLTEENASLRSRIEKLESQLKKGTNASTNLNGVKVKVEPTPETDRVTGCRTSFEPAVLSAIPLQKGSQVQQTLAFLFLMWALSLLIWTPPKSLRHLKLFLDKSLVQKHHSPILRRQNMPSGSSIGETSENAPAELVGDEGGHSGLGSPIQTADSTAAPIVFDQNVMSPTDADDDARSSTSELALPLEEASFGLLPIPVSPTCPVTPRSSVLEGSRKDVVENLEKFDSFNAFLDSGFGINECWSDEQLFPELSLDEVY